MIKLTRDEIWLGAPILNCFLEYFRGVQARIINSYNRDFDEEALTALIVEAFRNEPELEECIRSKALPLDGFYNYRSDQLILNISVRKELRYWESKQTGIDLAITFDIDVPPKKVKKSILIQAKILREENGDVILDRLVNETFENELSFLREYPERAAFILWYGPPKIKIPNRQNKDFGPRIMPVSCFEHYNEDPTMFHLLMDSIPFDEFLALNGLRTDVGSTDIFVKKIASGDLILENRGQRGDPNVRIGARGHIQFDLKSIEKSLLSER